MIRKILNWYIRNRRYIALLLIFQVAVWAMQVFTFTKEKDPRLMKYFNDNLKIITTFCNESQYYLPPMHAVYFGKMYATAAIAYCDIRFNGFKLIFDEEYWNELPEIDRQQLMFHEMAHCMLDAEHTPDVNHFMSPEMAHIEETVLKMQIMKFLTDKCTNTLSKK